MKKIILALFCLILFSGLRASQWTTNGINYTELTRTTSCANCLPLCQVTLTPNYSGPANIPSTILRDGTWTYVVAAISDAAFSGSFISGSVTLSDSLRNIGNNAFYNCVGLSGNLHFPDSLIGIGAHAFENCSGLTGTLEIPKKLKGLGGAFRNCSGFTSLIFNSTNAMVNGFEGCTGLTNVSFNNSIVYISGFTGCTGLSSVLLPANLQSIENNTFQNCTGLKSVRLPYAINNLGTNAFSNCTGLTSIYVSNPDPSTIGLGTDVFLNVPKNSCTLYVPLGSRALYQTANQWKDFFNIIEIITATDQLIDERIKLLPYSDQNKYIITGIAGKATLKLNDINGRTLMLMQSGDQAVISIESFPKGLYLLEIKSSDGSFVKKIQKK